MHVVLDPCFAGGAFPGPLGQSPAVGLGWTQAGPGLPRHAVAGQVWVGYGGLLGLLETALGLGGPVLSDAVRAASLIPALRRRQGFYSKSCERDPFGSARRLLEWRDMLCLAGWKPSAFQASSGAEVRRLLDLALVTRDVPPGFADRLPAVHAALLHRNSLRSAGVETGITLLELMEPNSDVPMLWRHVIGELERLGTVVRTRVPEEAAAEGDLLRAREPASAAGRRPHGDGSLQLVRAQGPLQAAEDVAAWLAAQPDEDRQATVIIGATPLLDTALHRHGLPTTGASAPALENTLLQVLPLALSLAWSPPDPERALELLTLPLSPVRARIAAGLVRALHTWPAVDSDVWRAALAQGLEAVEDPQDRERQAARLSVLFASSVARTSRYPAHEALRRAGTLVTWLQARAARDAEGAERYRAAIVQCGIFVDLVRASGLDELTAAELSRFVEESAAGSPPSAPYRAETGIRSVSSAGAVVGPAQRVVWWRFIRGTEGAAPTMPFTRAEREALLAREIKLIDPAVAAVCAARRWRRPLLAALRELVLVCPWHGEGGEELHPHPLWDEIVAQLGKSLVSGPDTLVRARPTARVVPMRQTPSPRELPAARRTFRIRTGLLKRPERLSATSLASLVGCPFRWVLEHVGRIRGGALAVLPDDRRLLGDLAHHILAALLARSLPHDTLRDGAAKPRPLLSSEAAAQAALELFDRDGPRLAAPLFLPGADAARADARRVTEQAVRALFEILADSKLTPIAVESECTREALGTTLCGRPDLVLGPSPAVVDLKWGGASYRRQELESGAAHQLAAYAHLVQEPASGAVPVAFYALSSQELVTTTPHLFRGARVVEGPDARETWKALESSVLARFTEVDSGELVAAGIPDDTGGGVPSQSSLADGRLELEPGCRFCNLHMLCGRAFGLTAEERS